MWDLDTLRKLNSKEEKRSEEERERIFQEETRRRAFSLRITKFERDAPLIDLICEN